MSNRKMQLLEFPTFVTSMELEVDGGGDILIIKLANGRMVVLTDDGEGTVAVGGYGSWENRDQLGAFIVKPEAP